MPVPPEYASEDPKHDVISVVVPEGNDCDVVPVKIPYGVGASKSERWMWRVHVPLKVEEPENVNAFTET